MVHLRQQKIKGIVREYVPLEIEGDANASIVLIGWGSTYGSIKSAVAGLLAEGQSVSHIHLRYIRPFPKNLGDLLKNFEHVLIPELNNGQLIKIIRDKYLVDAKAYNKIMGVPFTKQELTDEIRKLL